MPEIRYADLGNGLIHLIFIIVYFGAVAVSLRQEKIDEDKTKASVSKGCFVPVAAFSCLGVGLALLVAWSYFLAKDYPGGGLFDQTLFVPIVGQILISLLLIATSVAMIGNFQGGLLLYLISISVFGIATLYSLVFYETASEFGEMNVLTLLSITALLILVISGTLAYALQTLRTLNLPKSKTIPITRRALRR
jgi:hypothetical protein